MAAAAIPGLDNAIWASLTGPQSHLAQGAGLALRYRSDVSILAAVADTSAQAMADLAALVPADGGVILAQSFEIPVPAGVDCTMTAMACQMVGQVDDRPIRPAGEIAPLTQDDWPEMLALATLTQPGPFLLETPRLGDYFGVKQDGVLIAMAGVRMRLPGYTEISAICTHPDHRGRGLGTALCLFMRNRLVAQGQVPFLHAYQSNTAAIRLYETLGFVKSRDIFVTQFSKAKGA